MRFCNLPGVLLTAGLGKSFLTFFFVKFSHDYIHLGMYAAIFAYLTESNSLNKDNMLVLVWEILVSKYFFFEANNFSFVFPWDFNCQPKKALTVFVLTKKFFSPLHVETEKPKRLTLVFFFVQTALINFLVVTTKKLGSLLLTVPNVCFWGNCRFNSQKSILLICLKKCCENSWINSLCHQKKQREAAKATHCLNK